MTMKMTMMIIIHAVTVNAVVLLVKCLIFFRLEDKLESVDKFGVNTKYYHENLSRVRRAEPSGMTHGRTDMTRLTVAFRHCCGKGPKGHGKIHSM
jgi:hypothetical protein